MVLRTVLEGVSSLLMNNPDSRRVVGFGDLPDDKRAAHTRYLTPEGHLGVPQAGLRRCIVDASKFFKTIAGEHVKGGKTMPLKSALLGFLLLMPETPLLTLHRNGKPLPGDAYELDARWARNKTTKAQVWATRAAVRTPWELRIEIVLGLIFSRSVYTSGWVEELINTAGEAIGILNFRPEKGGTFGKFRVKGQMELIEE